MGVLALAACQRGAELRTRQDLLTPKPTVVIFIPGFKGSTLVEEKSGRTIWVNRYQALFNGEHLTFKGEALGLPPAPEVRPSGILDYIPVGVGYGLDPYRSFLQEAQQRLGQQVDIVPFAFDWRQDNVETARALAALVAEKRQNGAQHIWLWSHSMGGMIAAHYLRYGTQEPESARDTWEGARTVDGVVFAGTPFRGAAVIFGNLQVGAKTFRNTSLLSPEAMGSFPASYQLLPPESAQGVVFADGEQPQALAHLDVEVWQRHRWGLLQSASGDETLSVRRREFLKKSLARARAFSQRLLAPAASPPPASLQVLNVYGADNRAIARLLWLAASRDKPARWIALERDLPAGHAPLPFKLVEEGDEAVPVAAAQLPEAWQANAQVLKTPYPHANLFNDPAVRSAIFGKLQ